MKNKTKSPKVLLSFPMGLLVGAIIAFATAAIIDSQVQFVLLERYLPPLLTAAATLASASFAIAGVRWNIQNQNILAHDMRCRKLSAARASLPLALSEFVDLCDKHISHHANNTDQVIQGSESLSDTAHDTLKAVIENAEPETQHALSFLLMAYQVMLSRYFSKKSENKDEFDSEASRTLAKHNHASDIIYWASLKALASIQFGYARTKIEPIDYEVARKRFEFDLQHCKRSDGWLLVNDPTYQAYFCRAIENKESGFFKKDFFQQDR